jgi:hypothetical protein
MFHSILSSGGRIWKSLNRRQAKCLEQATCGIIETLEPRVLMSTYQVTSTVDFGDYELISQNFGADDAALF